jgi:hypothetical protein
MSVSAEVRRTLVKSPPELWTELSDPTTLGRHLGELGAIRIVGTEPERVVVWEAAASDGAGTSGRVEIEPSGWGTRVTLSASRAIVAPEPRSVAEPEPEAIAPEAMEFEPEAIEPEPELIEPEPKTMEPEPEAIEPEPELMEPESELIEPEPEIVEPRPGFFARLFRRRKAQPEPAPEPAPAPPEPQPESEPEPPPAAEVEELAPEEPTPAETAPARDGPEMDIAAELAELERQTTAVLTGVLDRLGAAHHRPFSRA